MASARRRKKQKQRSRQNQPGGSNSNAARPFPWHVFLLALSVVVFIDVVRLEIKSVSIKTPLFDKYKSLRGTTTTKIKNAFQINNNKTLYIPPSLNAANQRRLSIDHGDGKCEWTPPTYNVPENIDFHKTIITGFPSGDKRMIFVQMEALTGWPAKDEWDFEFLGTSNHPFIKANYPHHEGIWGWGGVADQSIIMIRNIRRSMVEYHDILWDIGYAKTWEDASLNLENLYSGAPPIEDFFAWRDWRVMEECHWYGWFIDYWMEGGLMRDMFTHKITTPEHWNMLMMPTVYTLAELDYDLVVGDDEVTPSYDPHCNNGDVTDGCEPIAVISAEKLRDYDEGPAETARIANVLLKDSRMGKYVIDPKAWDCIWTELIVKHKGLKTVHQRPGFVEKDYNFSSEMLEEMIWQLDRLIGKYSASPWNTKDTANRIVELIVEHRSLIQTELNEVNSGVRKLSERDFLGPKERRRRLKVKEEADPDGATSSTAKKDKKDPTEYFNELERKAFREKRKARRVKRRQAQRAKKEADAML